MTFLFRTPYGPSLALQCLAYRAMGHQGQDEDAPLDVIPVSLLKPTEGKCIHCGHMTEDQDEGEWLHEACRDELIAEQERDWRLDDPRRGQAQELNRR